MNIFLSVSRFTWKQIHILGWIIFITAVITKVVSSNLYELFAFLGYCLLFIAIPIGIITFSINIIFLFIPKYSQKYKRQIKQNLVMLAISFISCLFCYLFGIYLTYGKL